MKSPRSALMATVTATALLVIAAGCQDQAAKEELANLKAQMALLEQNKTLVKNLIEGLNNRDVRIYEDIYAPTAALYFPSASTQPVTPQEDLESSKNNWAAFPDIHWTIEDIVAEGDVVATRFIATGTQSAEWRGIPSMGKKFEGGGIFTVRIENGKVVEQREDFDLLGMIQQLGMEMRPASAKQ